MVVSDALDRDQPHVDTRKGPMLGRLHQDPITSTDLVVEDGFSSSRYVDLIYSLFNALDLIYFMIWIM